MDFEWGNWKLSVEMFNELACVSCSARTSSHPLCYYLFFINDLGDT